MRTACLDGLTPEAAPRALQHSQQIRNLVDVPILHRDQDRLHRDGRWLARAAAAPPVSRARRSTRTSCRSSSSAVPITSTGSDSRRLHMPARKCKRRADAWSASRRQPRCRIEPVWHASPSIRRFLVCRPADHCGCGRVVDSATSRSRSDPANARKTRKRTGGGGGTRLARRGAGEDGRGWPSPKIEEEAWS